MRRLTMLKESARRVANAYLERDRGFFLPPFKVNREIKSLKGIGMSDDLILKTLERKFDVGANMAKRLLSEYYRSL